MVNGTGNYKTVHSRDREYVKGRVKLTCMNRLFSNNLFRVHYENINNTVDYGSRSIVCHLLISGNCNTGHFDVLQNNCQILKNAN